MISLKNESVNLTGLSTQMCFAILVAASIFLEYGKPTVITSANDGEHKRNSKHYRGDGIDFRTRHLTSDEEQSIVHAITTALGPDFDVVLESTHLHIEYDPKRRV